MSTSVISELIASGRVATGPRQTLTREKADDRQKKIDALNKMAVERWDDPNFHREIATTLSTEADWGFWNQNLFSTWFPTRQVGFTDKLMVREMRGVKVYWVHRGGYIRESQIQTEDFEIPRDTIGYHFSEFEDKLRANFAETMEALSRLGDMRVEAEVNRRVFMMLQEAIPVGSPYYEDASTTGLTPAVLNTAIREVADTPQANGGVVNSVTVLSRSAGMAIISNFPGYSDVAQEEIRLRGRIGVYRGAALDQVRNYVDEDGKAYIPDNEVWVLGGQVGQFARFGGAVTKSWSENSADYVHYRQRQDLGGLIYHPENARRIIIDPADADNPTP